MGLGWQHILLFVVLALLLFGGNRFSAAMKDVAKGLKSFKEGMSDEDKNEAQQRPPEQQRQIPPQPPIDITPRSAEPVQTPPPADDQPR